MKKKKESISKNVEDENTDDEFKKAKNTQERINILVKKIKKLNAIQAGKGSRNFMKKR
jgi:hypothetical protein